MLKRFARFKKGARELIAVVDDEPDSIELIKSALEPDGFSVRGFASGQKLFEFLSGEKPNLIILDITMPGMGGLEICKKLKEEEDSSSIPVIIISARGDVSDKVLGLDVGSEDYIVKPFSVMELRARVRAVLRREEKAGGPKKIVAGPIMIDLERYEVMVNGQRVELTNTEMGILELLASRKGQVFTRNQLLEYLWGSDKVVIDRTIDVHIKHLREKLGKAGSQIENVRSVGYKLS